MGTRPLGDTVTDGASMGPICVLLNSNIHYNNKTGIARQSLLKGGGRMSI